METDNIITKGHKCPACGEKSVWFIIPRIKKGKKTIKKCMICPYGKSVRHRK
jgi:DNA-directed RNA polymerase subunit M/transcription elongation factor TFIIS